MKAGALAANTAHEAETASLEATEWRAGGAGPLLALWNCHPPWTAVAALYLFYTRKKKISIFSEPPSFSIFCL